MGLRERRHRLQRLPGGDCSETGPYDATRAIGAPDCANCLDDCPPGEGPGITPCSWFSQLPSQWLELTFDTPMTPTELRLWVTYTAPPGSILRVDVAPSETGPFTTLSGGAPVTPCDTPRTDDAYTLTYGLDGSTTVGAARLLVNASDIGIDAVGMR